MKIPHWLLVCTLVALIVVLGDCDPRCKNLVGDRTDATLRATIDAAEVATLEAQTRTAHEVTTTAFLAAVFATPTPSVTPSPKPSPSPTCVVPPTAISYLLNPCDVGPGYTQPGGVQMEWRKVNQDVSFSYSTMLVRPGIKITNYLKGQSRPFEKKDYEDYFKSGTSAPVPNVPTIGDASVVFTGTAKSGAPYAYSMFVKGNTMSIVQVSGGVTGTWTATGAAKLAKAASGPNQDTVLETVLRLSQTLAARLPTTVPVPEPLTFPEKLDKEAGAKVFKSLEIGKMEGGQFVPTAKFKLGDPVYLKTVPAVAGQTPVYSTARYSLLTKEYVEKRVGIVSGDTPQVAVDANETGKLECRVAVGDVLIAVFPFEVTQ